MMAFVATPNPSLVAVFFVSPEDAQHLSGVA
jgi:hypothetical protein